MQVRTLFFAGMAFTALLNLPKITQGLEATADSNAIKATAGNVRRSVKIEAREKVKSSSQALAAVASGCHVVFDPETGLSFPFEEGDTMQFLPTGDALPAGDFVCNADGRVGVLGEGGKVTFVVQAIPEDMAEFSRYFNALSTGNFEQLGETNDLSNP